jgi:UDP:flavonoid glycosyltransferase YjiC (YdhE family)
VSVEFMRGDESWDDPEVMSRTDADRIEVDVLDVADLREPGGVGNPVADAIAGRAAAGLLTGLVHVGGSPNELVAPVASAVRRALDSATARLVLPHERLRAKIVVVWQPAALSRAGSVMPAVDAGRVIVIGDGDRHDDTVRQACLRLFGREPVWQQSPPPVAELAGQAQPVAFPPASQPITPEPGTVLMVSSNGTGMGHLTRLLAYSRKAPSGTRPYFVSLSQAVPIVAEFGFPYEYVPSAVPTGMAPARWRTYLGRRLAEAIERLEPRVVVFDGTWAYEAIDDVRVRYRDVRWIWSRRGMWYRGLNRDQLAKSTWFDEVLEPGDFSSPADLGVTAGEPAVRVGPVTLLDRDEIVSRDEARSALGVDTDARTALVALGAGNINDATSATRIVIDALRKLDIDVCVTVAAIAERAGTDDEHVHLISAYPLSRYLRAFDIAVSAAGYNSFHELLRFGVPTLFLPNLETSLDDQRTRANYAAAQGWAHSLDRPEPDSVRAALDDLLRNGDAMVAKVADIDPGNGAAAAMELVASFARGGR